MDMDRAVGMLIALRRCSFEEALGRVVQSMAVPQ
jgi:hypothetical protein